MLMRYRPAVDGFSLHATRTMVEKFGLPGVLPLYDELQERGLSQADLCLELLHADLLPEVEALIGHPIKRAPAVKPVLPPVPPPRKMTPDDRRVRRVERNPRLPTTPAFQRFREFRVGASIRSLLKRGVTRRDIREAVNNQWVEFTCLQ